MTTVDDVRRRHRDHFLAIAEDADRATPRRWLLQVGGSDTALEGLDPDHDNIRAALRWSLDRGEAEQALRLAAAMTPYWMTRRLLGEARRWLEEALEEGATSPPAARARALYALSRVLQDLGDFPQSIAAARDAVAVARDAGDQRLLGRALWTLGDVLSWHASRQEMEAAHRESVEIFRALGDERELARALQALGTGLSYVWDAGADARPALAESLRMVRATGDGSFFNEMVGEFFVAAWTLGDHQEARALQQEALESARSSGDTAAAAHWSRALALAHLEAGELEEAARLLDAGATRDNAATEAYVGEVKARLALVRGDLDQVEELANYAVSLLRSRPDHVLYDQFTHAGALVLLGEVARRRGRSSEARARFEQAQDVPSLQETGAPPFITGRTFELLVALGDRSGALECLDRQLVLSRRWHDDRIGLLLRRWDATRARVAGDFELSRRLLEAALAEVRHERWMFLSELGRVALDEGDIAGARRCFVEAHPGMERAAGLRHLVRNRLDIAQACLAEGDVEEAKVWLAPIGRRWTDIRVPSWIRFSDPVIEAELLEALAAIAASIGPSEAVAPALRGAADLRDLLESPRGQSFPLPDVEFAGVEGFDVQAAVAAVLAPRG